MTSREVKEIVSALKLRIEMEKRGVHCAPIPTNESQWDGKTGRFRSIVSQKRAAQAAGLADCLACLPGQGRGTRFDGEGGRDLQIQRVPGFYTQGQDNNLGACRFYLKTGFRIGGLDTEVYKGSKQEGKADILFYWDV